jgi:pilus assembly protein CpaE
MPLHVIASNDTLLDTLCSSLQQNDLPLASAVLRTPGSNLLASLQALDDAPPGAIVLLDSPISFETTTNDDLVVLDGWLRQRPQLNVLLLSEDNSKALLTRAMRVGVREVLQLPPDPHELAQTLQRWNERAATQAITSKPIDATDMATALATPPTAPTAPTAPTPPARSGRLVAFMGCKGGNGTSFVAANMAHIMASEFGKKCAFVDLDLQCGDASFYLGSGANKHSLGDLTRQIDRLDVQLLASCLHPVTPRLNLLAAPHSLENAMAINPQDIEKVLTLVRSLHEHVVVDLPRNLNALTLKVLDMADVVYIVMQSQTPDVRDAQRLVNMMRALGLNETKLRLLVNRYKPRGWVSLPELEKAVGLKVQQRIPSGPEWVDESLHIGQPLSVVNDHNAMIHALREATSSLLESAPTKTAIGCSAGSAKTPEPPR